MKLAFSEATVRKKCKAFHKIAGLWRRLRRECRPFAWYCLGAYAGGTGLLDRNFETGVRVTKTECFRLESRL
jgi:hypothetical protein